MSNKIGRRTFLTVASSAGITALAGCSGSEPDGLNEHVDDEAKVHSHLSQGESIGAQYGDEHWRFTIEKIHNDTSIDIDIEKTLLDEVGQNKEGTDANISFKRTNINVGDIVTVENDLRIWYIEYNTGSAWIAIGEEYLTTCKESEFCEQ